MIRCKPTTYILTAQMPPQILYTDKKVLGKRLRQQREKRKKSLRGLAGECNMSFATLNDIENGNTFPTRDVILRLVEKLFPSDKKRIEVYDLYGDLKKSAPPDIIAFLHENKDVVAEVRKRMNERKEGSKL